MPVEPPALPSDERVTAGDMLNVRVFNQEPMSARGRVRSNGAFALPILGEVPVEGKRPAELARELEVQLEKYIVSPHVNVTIEETAPVKVSVVGEVRRAGPLALEAPARVVHALAGAGGVTEFADDSRIFVLRQAASGQVQRIRFTYEELSRGEPHATSFRLHNGDVIVVE
jgi:polysaccharide export outer membrane protein